MESLLEPEPAARGVLLTIRSYWLEKKLDEPMLKRRLHEMPWHNHLGVFLQGSGGLDLVECAERR